VTLGRALRDQVGPFTLAAARVGIAALLFLLLIPRLPAEERRQSHRGNDHVERQRPSGAVGKPAGGAEKKRRQEGDLFRGEPGHEYKAQGKERHC